MQKLNMPLHRFKCAALLALCLLLMMAATTACAIDPIDEMRKTSMTIVAKYEGKPLTGMTFNLYRVADMQDFGSFTFTPAFADTDISSDGRLPDDMTSKEWDDLSQTLAGYAEKQTPFASGKIASNGTLTFTQGNRGEFMGVGLYLLVGKSHTLDGVLYATKPSLISLPGRDAYDEWIYHQTVYPKPEPPKNIYVDIEVVKVWKDSSYTCRPQKVTVDLLYNGCVIETIELSAANNWKHCWKNKRFDCKVAERPVGDSYTVRVCRSGNRFVVTNTRPGPKPVRPSTLPQTGQLWWPVPLLAGGGMVLFLIGWLRRRNDEEE